MGSPTKTAVKTQVRLVPEVYWIVHRCRYPRDDEDDDGGPRKRTSEPVNQKVNI